MPSVTGEVLECSTLPLPTREAIRDVKQTGEVWHSKDKSATQLAVRYSGWLQQNKAYWHPVKVGYRIIDELNYVM